MNPTFLRRENRFLLLGLFSLFSTLMYLTRSLVSGELIYAFLIWNLFLAWIPLLIAHHLEKNKRSLSLIYFTAMSLIWLLFFPNAPYIITDLLHLKPRNSIPLWYDLGMLFSFALTGFALGLWSLRKMHLAFEDRFSAGSAKILVLLSVFLGAFGIYLGRFLRWNSWDILADPLELLRDIALRFAFPHHHLHTWAITLVFGTIILFSYLLIFPSTHQEKKM